MRYEVYVWLVVYEGSMILVLLVHLGLDPVAGESMLVEEADTPNDGDN